MGQNMMQWVDNMIAGDRKRTMPVLSFPSVQKMGITVRELLMSSDLMAQGIRTVADACPEAAAAVSYMDLSLEAEAFGSTIRFSDEEVPTVIGAIVNDEDEAEALVVPEVGAGRTGLNIDAMRKARELITDRPLFAGTIGPFSLAGRLMDVSMAMIYCFDEPDMVHTVLEKVTEFLIRYLTAYKEKLLALDGDYKNAVAESEKKTLLFADRFPFRYLTDDYGLDYYAAFTGCSAETEAGFETVIFLSNKADELKLDIILTIENSDKKLAETIRNNTDGKDQQIMVLNSMQGLTLKDVKNGAGYLSIMTDNLNTLKAALR